MFDNLSNRLTSSLDRIRGRAKLTEDNIQEVLREVRMALLEADVALPVVKDLIAAVKERAIGTEVSKSLSPGQVFLKIVKQELESVMGEANDGLNLRVARPAVILLAGLQGAGKTTTCGKLALKLKREKRNPLLVPADVYRPAAIEQLKTLGRQLDIPVFDSRADQDPGGIGRLAQGFADRQGYDTLILDTAGRLHVDDTLMQELERICADVQPQEILLVADAMTGQDAVNVASSFNERLNLTGVVLTKLDGDARGGAALSIRAVTGKPIKFVGLGEKLDALEEFHPERVAGRILGMGDIVSLVEKAQETIEQQDAERMMKRFQKGRFDMNDLKSQLEQMQKMGGMAGVRGMLPGMGKMTKQMEASGLDDRVLKRQIAIIQSMTKIERKKPELMQASRKKLQADLAELQSKSHMQSNTLISVKSKRDALQTDLADLQEEMAAQQKLAALSESTQKSLEDDLTLTREEIAKLLANQQQTIEQATRTRKQLEEQLAIERRQLKKLEQSIKEYQVDRPCTAEQLEKMADEQARKEKGTAQTQTERKTIRKGHY